MLIRLGHALYWFCSLMAVIIVAFGVAAWFDKFSAQPDGPIVMMVFGAAAAVVWVIGFGVRYVLAGN